MQAQLTPWQNWCQLRDPMPQGLPENNAANDCGEEAVAEVIWHLTGISLEAEYVKDEMYGADYQGYSDAAHLAGYLQDKAGIPVKTFAGDASTLLQPTVQAALAVGCPLIVLFFSDLVNLTGGHWCPVVACDDQVVTRSNPWTGQEETWSWAQFERSQSYGTALVCCRRRSIVDVIPFLDNYRPAQPPAQAQTRTQTQAPMQTMSNGHRP
jgi:hypothetical protein